MEGFDRALAKTGGDATSHDLWIQARNGSAFLFVAHDGTEMHGASLWRPETWSTGQKFRCLALFGNDMKAWIADMRASVEQAAGRAALVSEGRRGWVKIFPDAKELRALYEVPVNG
jgi:hypothetical protein